VQLTVAGRFNQIIMMLHGKRNDHYMVAFNRERVWPDWHAQFSRIEVPINVDRASQRDTPSRLDSLLLSRNVCPYARAR
jgi:hypothetical protein